jgi:hypothetical protein
MSCLDDLAAQDPVASCDERCRADLVSLLQAHNQLSAIIAGVVGTFDARGLSETDAVRATRTWLVAFGRMSQGAASGWLSRSRLLRELPVLAAAGRDGRVSAEHVAKVADLANKVGVAAIREFDPILTDLASASQPQDVAAACERIRAHVDPDGPAPDPHAAFERRQFTLARCGSMVSVRGQLDPEGAAALMTAIDALMNPPAADDLRTAAQRRADAIVELARLGLTTGQLPTIGGIRPQVGVIITPSTLLTSHRYTNHPPRPQTRPRPRRTQTRRRQTRRPQTRRPLAPTPIRRQTHPAPTPTIAASVGTLPASATNPASTSTTADMIRKNTLTDTMRTSTTRRRSQTTTLIRGIRTGTLTNRTRTAPSSRRTWTTSLMPRAPTSTLTGRARTIPVSRATSTTSLIPSSRRNALVRCSPISLATGRIPTIETGRVRIA